MSRLSYHSLDHFRVYLHILSEEVKNKLVTNDFDRYLWTCTARIVRAGFQFPYQ